MIWVIRFDEVVVGVSHLLWCVYDGHLISTMAAIDEKKEKMKVGKKQSCVSEYKTSRGEV